MMEEIEIIRNLRAKKGILFGHHVHVMLISEGIVVAKVVEQRREEERMGGIL